jgi:hypothetical protein
MAIGILQASDNQSTNTMAVTGVTAGSILLVHIAISTPTGVSDNVNGAWTLHQTNGTNAFQEYIFIGSAAGAFTITVAATSTFNILFHEIGGFTGAGKVLGKSINQQSVSASNVDILTSNTATNIYQECYAVGFGTVNFVNPGCSAGPGWQAVFPPSFNGEGMTVAKTLSTSNVAVAATFYPLGGAPNNANSSVTLFGNAAQPRVAWIHL